jgi:uroporphyrinogen decarboxylase
VRPADPGAGVFGEHLEALRLVISGVAGEADVIHTIFSPLAVVASLCGPGTEFIACAGANPAGAHTALAAVTLTLAAYSLAALDAGASGIFFAPLAWASHDSSSEEFYREFGRPYDLQVLAAIRDAEFNVLHVCRNHNMVDLLLDYPVAAVHWADRGEGNPSLAEVKARTAKAVMGGVDHVRLAAMSPDEVAAQVQEALAVGPGRLLVAAGCSIPPETPAANRAAVAAAVRG